MSKSLIIGCDLDGVIRDLVGQLIRVYRRYDPDFKLEKDDIVEYDLSRFFPIGRGIYDFMWVQHVKEVLEDAPMIRGASKFIDDLRKIGKVLIITHQPHTAFEATVNWIVRHKIHRRVDGIVVLRGGLGKDISKSDLGLDVLIDDSSANLEEFHPKERAVALAQPWNRDWRGPRFEGYDEIVRYLRSIVG